VNRASKQDPLLYNELEHTGDLAIEITAPARAELFRRAALALAALLVESSVKGSEVRRIKVTADDDAALMHDLLTELLQLFAADGFIWQDVSVAEHERQLYVTMRGEFYHPAHHMTRDEIKAVTYHQLTVENIDHRWRASIIFDV